MTTLSTATPPRTSAARRPGIRRRAVGWAAAAGTLPYLTLKALWLSGSTIGARDPAFLADPSVVVLNGVTVTMDLLVIALAFALTQRWGRRLPAWPVLLPMWVGTGLLLPMALAILPATVVSLLTSHVSAIPLEPWVQPMVYGGFAWQGVFLLVAFAGYARDRWGAVVDRAAAAPAQAAALAPLLRVIAGGGAAAAVLSAGLHLLAGALSGEVLAAGVETINAGLAVAGAAGVLALVRGANRRWVATTAGWVGTAAMFSWGLWAAVTTMGSTALSAAGDPLAGFAQLSGLLGGFALAVAGLLAVVGTGVARRGRRPGGPAGGWAGGRAGVIAASVGRRPYSRPYDDLPRVSDGVPTVAPMTTSLEKTADLLRAVLAELAPVVGGIAPGQLHDPTPCTAFDVEQLRDHVLGWLTTFAAGFADRTARHRGPISTGTARPPTPPWRCVPRPTSSTVRCAAGPPSGRCGSATAPCPATSRSA